MSTAGRAPLRAFAHRRAPRCSLTVPVRITVLRAGTAYSFTGRAVDLGEGGIAVSLAGEVHASDSVAVEFLLPDLGLGLQARAVVRYHIASHSGFEFRGLTRHQQAVIREWTRQRQSPARQETASSLERAEPRKSRYALPVAPAHVQRVLWSILAVLVLAGLIAWWHWERGWKELEDQINQPTVQMMQASPWLSGNSSWVQPTGHFMS